MLHFKNSRRPHLAALLHTLYTIFTVRLSYFCMSFARGYKEDALSHGWLWPFFELCMYANWIPTLIILKHSLDFSNTDMAGARWPCKDIGVQLLAACDVGDILVEQRPLPSEEIAAWLPSTADLDPCGVLGVLGDLGPRQAGQGHSGWDGIGPLRSLCETDGRVGKQCGMQVGAAAAQ